MSPTASGGISYRQIVGIALGLVLVAGMYYLCDSYGDYAYTRGAEDTANGGGHT